MAKKKNKFKKSKKQQVENVISSNQAVEIANPTSEPLGGANDTPRPNIEETPDAYKTDKYDHVKKDIRKILYIMLSIVIVLFVVYFVNEKTSLFGSFGNWIYKILNIQTS